MPEALPYSGVPEVTAEATPTGYQHLDISSDAFGGGVAKGLQEVGKATDDLTFKYMQMHNQTQALNAGSDYAQHVGQIESEYHQLEGTNATAALPDFQQRIQKAQEQFSQDLSPATRRMFLQDTRSMTDNTLVRMGSHAGEQAKTAHNDALLGSITQTRSDITRQALAGQALNPESLDQLVTRVSQYGQFRGMEKPAVDAFLQKQTGDMTQDVIDATLAKGDPQSTQRARQIFDSVKERNIPGTDVPMMDGDHLARVNQTITNREYFDEMKAQREEVHQSASLRTAITSTMTNATAMVERGLPIPDQFRMPSDEDIDRAYAQNPEMAEVMKDHRDTVSAMSTFATQLAGATPEQAAALRLKVQPDPANSQDFAKQAHIAAAFDHALDVRNRALFGSPPTAADPDGTAGDPANYVLSTHQELQPVLEAARKDPKLWDNYFHAQATLQGQMGVPEAQQHYLPASMAQAVSQGLQQNPTTAPGQIRALQQQFGSNWGKAWRDLVGLGHLPPEYQVVGLLPAGDANVLARALSQGGHNGKFIEELLPGPTHGNQAPKTIIDDFVQGDAMAGAMHDYLNSTRVQGFSPAARVALLSAVKKLAYGNMVDRGMEAADAAQAAVSSITAGYQYMGTARIPTDKFDTVSQNAALTLQNLKPGSIAMPQLFGQPIKSADGTVLSGPAMTPDDYLRSLQTSPQWITNPNGDGLMLMDLGGRLVRDTKGQPLTVPFAAPPPAVRPRMPGDLPPGFPEVPIGPFGQNDTSRFTGVGGPNPDEDTETVVAPGGWTGQSARTVDAANFPYDIRRHVESLGSNTAAVVAYLNKVDPRGTFRGVSQRASEDGPQFRPAAAAAAPGYKPGELDEFGAQLEREAHPNEQPGAVFAHATPGQPAGEARQGDREALMARAPKIAAELDRMFPKKPGDVISFTAIDHMRNILGATDEARSRDLAGKLRDIEDTHQEQQKTNQLVSRIQDVPNGPQLDELLKQADAKWDTLTALQKVIVVRRHINQLPDKVLATLEDAFTKASR